jgi:hypothetical protein
LGINAILLSSVFASETKRMLRSLKPGLPRQNSRKEPR